MSASIPTVLIPARGGSRRTWRKNLLELGGKPLVARAIELTRSAFPEARIVVSTDDDTIAAVAHIHGAIVDRSFPHTDESSVDECAYHYRKRWDGGILVYQPTVVGVSADTLRRMVEMGNEFSPLALTVSSGHIYYGDHGDQLTKRNHASSVQREIGVRYYPSPGQLELFPFFTEDPAIDIDTPDDFEAARQMVERLRIHFCVATGIEVGRGHIYRTLELMRHLQRHDLSYSLVGSDDAEIKFASAQLGRIATYVTAIKADVIVTDVLSTSTARMSAWRGYAPVVSIEDSGPGVRLASFAIDPMRSGDMHYVTMPPEFAGLPTRTDKGEGVLVTFGGTDPAELTEMVMPLLRRGDTVIVPPGAGDIRAAKIESLSHSGIIVKRSPVMVRELRRSRLVVCSAGRTALEAAAVGTPAIVMAQNAKETTHSHLGPRFGNTYLGLGRTVTSSDLANTISQLRFDDALWVELHGATIGLIDGRGTHRLARMIEAIGQEGQ